MPAQQGYLQAALPYKDQEGLVYHGGRCRRIPVTVTAGRTEGGRERAKATPNGQGNTTVGYHLACTS